jgi:hypothetical protein
MFRALLSLLLLFASSLAAADPVYVVLWFDTGDYIEPADDAALRIANDLTAEASGRRSKWSARRRGCSSRAVGAM